MAHTPHTWTNGEIVSATILNALEQDLAGAADADTLGTAATHAATDFDPAGAAADAQAAAVAAAATSAATAAKSADTITDGNTNKAYTAVEQTKLAGIAPAATANATDAALRDRTTHTGTQTATTISDFTEAVQDAVAALLGAGSNVILTYDDAANSLTVSATAAGGTGLDAEQVRDTIGVALVGVGNIAVTVNDAADTITITTTATVNSTDAQLRDRSTHTGTQPASTVTGLAAVATTGVYTDLAGRPTLGTAAAQNTTAFDPAGAAAAITAAGLGVVAATTSVAGLAERATNTEATAGTDDTRYVSPLGIKSAIDARNYTATSVDGVNVPTLNISSTPITATDLGLGNVNNTSDANKPISTAQAAVNAAKADLVGGVVPTAQLPALALTATQVVASQAAMLALTTSQVQPGDLAVRTDGAGTYILTATDPSILGNWTRLNAPTDAVTSVNGHTGTVALTATDVGADPAGAAAAVTKTTLGLGNVDNTADTDKPVSTAQQTALNAKAPLVSPTFTGTVSGITATMVGADPAGSAAAVTAASLGIGAATTTAAGLAERATNTETLTGSDDALYVTPLGVKSAIDARDYTAVTVDTVAASTLDIDSSPVTAADLGLGNVTNTADVDKPVSTAQQTALDLKAPLASPTFTGTVSGITAAMVGADVAGAAAAVTASSIGLGNVTNTSDANKPVSTAQQAALDAKADKNLTVVTFTNLTMDTSHAGKLLECTSASAATLSVPLNSAAAFPTGTTVNVYVAGAGQLTIGWTAGVTVNSRGSVYKSAGQYALLTLVKVDTDTWVLAGDITA